MEPVSRVSVIDQVVDKIKEYVDQAELSVGDRMPTEKALSEMLGVGRSTIREALRILQTLGYVTIEQGRGAFYAGTPDPNASSLVEWFSAHGAEILDFFEVRFAIEPLSVRLATVRATDEEIHHIWSLFEQFEAAFNDRNPSLVAELDQAFHSAIIDASHNSLLASINQNLESAFDEYRSTIFSSERYAVRAVAPHRRIAQAICERDRKRASDEMTRHLMISLQDIAEIMNLDHPYGDQADFFDLELKQP